MENYENRQELNTFLSDDDAAEIYEENNVCGINITSEKIFWENILIPFMSLPPTICPSCKTNNLIKNNIRKDNLLQPYRLRCSKKNCRKKVSYRNYSFFKLHKQLTCTVIYSIIKKFFLKKKY